MADLQREIERRAVEGQLPCMAAFAIAEAAGVRPDEVRAQADRSGMRIAHCQLGLFGYAAFGDKRFAVALTRVPERLNVALRGAMIEGAVSCAAAWSIADREGLPKPVVGSAAEALRIRIAPCQLGCF